MQMQMLDDQRLIELYLQGNERAFEELFSRYKDRIYTTIFLFVKDHEMADDIFQDVFIKIIRTLREGKYQHEGKFSQWAVRIAYNLCVDYFRRSKRRNIVNPTEDFDIFDIIEDTDPNGEEQIIKEQEHRQVKKWLEKLSPEQREVVILRHYAEMSFKEIAMLTGVSINTALGRMRYALINLRKIMKGESSRALKPSVAE